jgi:iron(III) transport system ATP-binding protein
VSGEAFVSVEALQVDYGAKPAVDGVGFTVAAGEHLTLLGPSGCGKTTLLRAIAGLERPSAGRIVLDGTTMFDGERRIDVPPERRSLSMVFQSYAIWPHMSVFDNVAFSFRVRGTSRPAARPHVERALDLVGLRALADRPATQLSGGQQQRVALARAIAYQSKLVLFDEPLSNLDAQLRVSMRAELADLHQRLGFTTIYVTHDQEEAFALSDRIIVMDAGRVAQEGTPESIHSAPRSRFVARFLGIANIFDAQLARAEGGMCDARLGDDLVLRCRAPEGGGIQKGAICFRPIDVEIASMTSGATGITGTVSSMMFLGDLVQYKIASGILEVIALDRPRPDLAVGQQVRWSVSPEHCLALLE